MTNHSVYDALNKLGINLPEPPPPAANYVPVKRVGNLLFVSGQAPREGRTYLYTGKLGDDISIEVGQEAARRCVLNVLAQLEAYTDGNLQRIVSCVKVNGYINATPDFTDHPKVLNGASDLLCALLGDAGAHARTAVGCPSLPGNIPVEVEAVFEIE
ncbi:RidA family protein [Mesorhizobium sp. SP-1A]|uniref:RidA family protein n=1 Tax=Mesorhizobium sp. SP-1A TaxID=3077840 RepID=UPI0028F73131|nr:RidA family protein [Mesorhizobium sp. SP-1A]